MDKKYDQTDILGQPLVVGDYVAYSRGSSLYIAKVCKVTPMMIRVRVLNEPSYDGDVGQLCYSHNTVRLSGPDAVSYILKYAK